jgi:hypothetical protein
VVVSLTRAADPKSPLRGNLPGLKAVEKVDDLTVDVVMAGPTPATEQLPDQHLHPGFRLAGEPMAPRPHRRSPRARKATPPTTPTAPARSSWKAAGPMR